jgi:hypothetical protein
MKKIFLILFSLLMVTVVFGQSVNPIPSYNVFVTGNAVFVSQNIAVAGTNNQILSADKRDMDVENDGGAKPTDPRSPIVVYIFTLDHSVVFGPYIVPSGQTLSVPIDDSAWGVSISTDSPTFVSVWTDDGSNTYTNRKTSRNSN